MLQPDVQFLCQVAQRCWYPLVFHVLCEPDFHRPTASVGFRKEKNCQRSGAAAWFVFRDVGGEEDIHQKAIEPARVAHHCQTEYRILHAEAVGAPLVVAGQPATGSVVVVEICVLDVVFQSLQASLQPPVFFPGRTHLLLLKLCGQVVEEVAEAGTYRFQCLLISGSD